ncbi:sigma-70 family RNA polymerase sigma factor [Petrimonas sulfuriphila]|jgi:RNA polymerase sigma factor (sigma-70 family)|uniref:RNA polymerase sigma factor n=1 Tax=Dysgonomonadaceae TaxID=2005520 RepID=UPI000E8CBFE0|nr:MULTISPECIES: sigma-70 family RNA polymerase sigma factor [unclassified Proteiniphilum]MEA5071079.1 sigma-70 family RNA polymerase sigma factor [Petrimonas sp.]NLU29657.1 sigma-70 family RNA polymerase sigma factor [Bacteroidales bacterium]HBG79563.1 RNA polymerase subunit sigma-70 [Porphyromonadaceae bacterium]HCA99418.1 RNA polymerase subunit sigma-70 [Porphyromonadaceae bacterium]HCF82096.1 RNA polymerase subunit sigma-70 [Porphyromonadaceae bacterium]
MGKEAWKRFLAGDERSFEALYNTYFPELFAYALKIGFNEETCKDAIHDVFFKLYASKNKLRHIQNIEFYLLGSVKNRLFDIHTIEHKIHEINYLDFFIENEKNIIEQIIDEERQLQLQKKLSHLLQTLPPRQRKIINYHYQLNLNYAEIGEILNLSPDAVKKTLYRALKKMKDNSRPHSLSSLIYLFTIFG